MGEAGQQSAPGWLRALRGARVVAGTPADATDITHDSRRVHDGSIFVAIPGASADGNSFIPAAIAVGARSIISRKTDAHRGYR